MARDPGLADRPDHAGVNLLGGDVLADVRGRDVYRALVGARRKLAVKRGTPA